jgi:hypothetical protein
MQTVSLNKQCRRKMAGKSGGKAIQIHGNGGGE